MKINIKSNFLQQNSKDELSNACGAFCIKYWQWHSGMEDPNTVRQREKIFDVYKSIQFGSYGAKLNLPSVYSNPLKKCELYNCSYIFDPQNQSFAYSAKIMSEQIMGVNIIEEKLLLNVGKYAILIIENENGEYHYILIYRKCDEEYYYHDPVKSNPLPLIGGIPMIGDDIDKNNYKYTGAGILLP